MSNPAPQGAPGAAPPQQQLLKADDIPKLQCLSDDMKQKYRPVVQNLWTIMQTKPTGSVEYNQARQKVQDWSSKLIAQERAHRNKIKAQQLQQQQQQQQQQPAQVANRPQSLPGVQQVPQPANNQQPAQAPQQQQQQAEQSTQQPANAQGQGPPQANQRSSEPIDPQIIKHTTEFKYHLPLSGPQVGTPEGDKRIAEMRHSYASALGRQHKITGRIRLLENMIKQKQNNGQEVPAEYLANKAPLEKEMEHARDFVKEFRAKQAQNKNDQERFRAQQQAQPPQPSIKEEPQIKVEGGQLPQAMPAQQFNMQGSAPAQSQPAQHQNPQAPGPSLPPQPMRQPPAPLSQQAQQQNQSQMFTQPGQAHGRPQINPHQANAMQQQQTNSPHPHSATSNITGQPIPLTHQAAVTAAQRSYSNTDGGQRTATPMQQAGPGGFQAPGSREREQLNNPKMPIPRNLNVSQPQPVGMGQARPTMSGPTNGAPGPMGQPVISKFPQFQLEGEGDRVLSKRKLDELVRQVTGGSDEALTPEVEDVSTVLLSCIV
jgi:transcription initiation factor TFIID subunit 12